MTLQQNLMKIRLITKCGMINQAWGFLVEWKKSKNRRALYRQKGNLFRFGPAIDYYFRSRVDIALFANER